MRSRNASHIEHRHTISAVNQQQQQQQTTGDDDDPVPKTNSYIIISLCSIKDTLKMKPPFAIVHH